MGIKQVLTWSASRFIAWTGWLYSWYLVDTHYLALAKNNIRGTLNIEISPVTEEKKICVGKLGRILHSRIAKHIRTKVNNPSKHNHPALLSVKSNLNRFTALLYFFEHAKYSRVLNQKSSILKDTSKGWFVAATDDDLEESYSKAVNRLRLDLTDNSAGWLCSDGFSTFVRMCLASRWWRMRPSLSTNIFFSSVTGDI